MACNIDSHPIVEDINDLLRSGGSFGEVRRLCLEGEYPVPAKATMSRHIKHLGLPSRGVRVQEPEFESDDGSGDDPVPDVSQLRDLALKEFYKRLRHSPKSIQTRELVPILTQILRLEADKKPTDQMDDLLSQLNG